MTHLAVVAAVSAGLAVGSYLTVDALADAQLRPPRLEARVVTVQAKVDGKPVAWWAARSRLNGSRARGYRAHWQVEKRNGQARARTVRKLRRDLHVRWAPTVDYALRLAAAAYAPFGGPTYAELYRVAHCESTLNPFAKNGQYLGLWQKHWTPFGQFSVNDPVADTLDTVATVIHDGGWRQWECKP